MQETLFFVGWILQVKLQAIYEKRGLSKAIYMRSFIP